MHCLDFIGHYSAFRDRVGADTDLLRELDEHLMSCATCARYHESVRRGVDLLKRHDVLEPSPDFSRRLRGRLAQSFDDAPVLPAPASIAAALMFASALTLGVYEIAARREAPVAVAAVTPVRHPSTTMPYAAQPRVLPASDFTLTAFHRGPKRPPVLVLEMTPVALGAWASLPH
jgi:hypothetical protein